MLLSHVLENVLTLAVPKWPRNV